MSEAEKAAGEGKFEGRSLTRKSTAPRKVHATALTRGGATGVHRAESSSSSDDEPAPQRPLGPAAKRPLVIFDWDDTLFPTTWLKQTWKPQCRRWFKTPLPKDKKKMVKPLEDCIRISTQLFDLAKELATVILVTNSQRPWVTSSSELFAPRIIPSFTKPYVPTYYALEYMPPLEYDEEDDDDTLDLKEEAYYTECKRKCMAENVANYFADEPEPARSPRHIISIGDGIFEDTAAKQLRGEEKKKLSCYRDKKCWMKTVKLMEEPDIEQLVAQLRILEAWLPKMLSVEDDFDCSLEDPTEADLQKYKRMFD